MIVVLVVDGEANEVWDVTSTTKPPRPWSDFDRDWQECRTAFQSIPYFTSEVVDAVRARGWQLTGVEFMEVID